MQELLEKIYIGSVLTQEESQQLFHHMMSGSLEPTQFAAALIAMKARGEHPHEIAGAATASLQHAQPFEHPHYMFADIVGTGGDGANSINISTASAFVAAACGLPIAKHGNCSVSSKSGSSDVLTELGLKLDMDAHTSRTALDDLGVCFLFAQQYHPGFKHAAPIRKQLKTRTIFNILGPLINPARPPLALIGVYSPKLVTPVAETLRLLGYKRAAVVHGNGTDEVAIHGSTQVAELYKGEIISYELTPQDFGLPTYTLADIEGGSPKENSVALAHLLQGKGQPAHEAAIIANVALLMRLFGKEDIQENAREDLSVIRSGKPYQHLEALACRG
ncbi:MAG: anthranilate phosphoribosyltransferase [Saezia sp.]